MCFATLPLPRKKFSTGLAQFLGISWLSSFDSQNNVSFFCLFLFIYLFLLSCWRQIWTRISLDILSMKPIKTSYIQPQLSPGSTNRDKIRKTRLFLLNRMLKYFWIYFRDFLWTPIFWMCSEHYAHWFSVIPDYSHAWVVFSHLSAIKCSAIDSCVAQIKFHIWSWQITKEIYLYIKCE